MLQTAVSNSCSDINFPQYFSGQANVFLQFEGRHLPEKLKDFLAHIKGTPRALADFLAVIADILAGRERAEIHSETLIRRCHVSVPTLRRYVRAARQLGFIAVERQGKGLPNIYSLLAHSWIEFQSSCEHTALVAQLNGQVADSIDLDSSTSDVSKVTHHSNTTEAKLPAAFPSTPSVPQPEAVGATSSDVSVLIHHFASAAPALPAVNVAGDSAGADGIGAHGSSDVSKVTHHFASAEPLQPAVITASEVDIGNERNESSLSDVSGVIHHFPCAQPAQAPVITGADSGTANGIASEGSSERSSDVSKVTHHFSSDQPDQPEQPALPTHPITDLTDSQTDNKSNQPLEGLPDLERSTRSSHACMHMHNAFKSLNLNINAMHVHGADRDQLDPSGQVAHQQNGKVSSSRTAVAAAQQLPDAVAYPDASPAQYQQLAAVIQFQSQSQDRVRFTDGKLHSRPRDARSKHPFQTCYEFALYESRTKGSIRIPEAYAYSIVRSGAADALIEEWLLLRASLSVGASPQSPINAPSQINRDSVAATAWQGPVPVQEQGEGIDTGCLINLGEIIWRLVDAKIVDQLVDEQIQSLTTSGVIQFQPENPEHDEEIFAWVNRQFEFRLACDYVQHYGNLNPDQAQIQAFIQRKFGNC